MDDLISRQQALDAAIKADMENHDGILSEKRARVLEEHISILPTAQPEPSQIARDIATIIENEQDMRVILKNAQPERMRGRLLNEDELRDLSVTLDGLITYLGSIAQDVVGATHYRHRVNEMLIMLMKEGEQK